MAFGGSWRSVQFVFTCTVQMKHCPAPKQHDMKVTPSPYYCLFIYMALQSWYSH